MYCSVFRLSLLYTLWAIGLAILQRRAVANTVGIAIVLRGTGGCPWQTQHHTDRHQAVHNNTHVGRQGSPICLLPQGQPLPGISSLVTFYEDDLLPFL
jgi:hypothetical protein